MAFHVEAARASANCEFQVGFVGVDLEGAGTLAFRVLIAGMRM